VSKSKKHSVKTRVVVLASLVVLFAIALILWTYSEQTRVPAFANVSIGGRYYNVYLAVTLDQQAKGLMNVTSMGDCGGHGNCLGMLFVSPKPPCFWMKDTPLPLRQYWISGNEISYVWTGVPQSTEVICSNGNLVLETNTSTNFAIGEGFEIIDEFG
jgi:uncharacterized membrane protein (UPF0127 family)